MNLSLIPSNDNQLLTMSSREIAELTGKRHDHVMRDIRNMLEELGITGPSFGGSYQDSTGRTLPCFNLPKDLTITLVSGYSVQMRHRIVTRWMELEAQQQAAVPALPYASNSSTSSVVNRMVSSTAPSSNSSH